MRIFLTGSSGFIGSHFAIMAQQRGHEIVCASYHDQWTDQGQGCDAVAHFAAYCNTQDQRYDRFFYDGTLLTYQAIQTARRIGARVFLFASSGAVYGEPGRPVVEDTPLYPISAYGASKVAGEAMVWAAQEQCGIRGVCLRLCGVVGPRQPRGVLVDLLHRLKQDPHRLVVKGNGQQQRQFVHVDDAVTAALLALESGQGAYNVAGDGLVSIARVVEIACSALGVQPILEYEGGRQGWRGDVPVLEMVTDRIRQLGWHPSLNSEGALTLAAEELSCKLSSCAEEKEHVPARLSAPNAC